MKALKLISLSGLLFCAVLTGYLAWYVRQAPNLGRLTDVSQVIRTQDGTIINLRLTKDGYWREKATLGTIDPKLVNVLIAYEDQRFWDHRGVDPKAVIRASYDFVKSGRVVSGASTLTMQVAKLMDPSLKRRHPIVKIKQMLAALRLEYHWNKEEILEAYFTLAPYGGNIEGIHAATEAWFQKTPERLTLNEAALLVALPQSPETRRPDRHPERAFRAKQMVILRVKDRIDFDYELVSEVASEPLPSRLVKPKSIAPHLADKLSEKSDGSVETFIRAEWQKQVQHLVVSELAKYSAPIQAAAMVVERQSGKVKAYVGSADYASEDRKGANNYLTAIRSPGSTLKPLIYGKAIQRNLIRYDHVFDDKEFYRGGYTPTNFDNTFSGKVTLKDALIRSLNIPALKALEKVGPELFESEITTLLGNALTEGQNAGLSLAVGGYYLSAEQLLDLYLKAFDPNTASKLTLVNDQSEVSSESDAPLFNQETADQLLNLLIQEMPNGEKVAFKTGTSYARQDAWSVQIYEDHLVLAWFGTPDNKATDLLTGRTAAFPMSLEIGRALGLKPPKTPVLRLTNDEIAATLEPVCETLINYPENGAWIRSEDAILSVLGSQNADWYLNAEKLGSYSKQIKVSRPGVHKLTARSGKCSQTTEVFVEFH
jgi:penicillin-binding protein 1C